MTFASPNFAIRHEKYLAPYHSTKSRNRGRSQMSIFSDSPPKAKFNPGFHGQVAQMQW